MSVENENKNLINPVNNDAVVKLDEQDPHNVDKPDDQNVQKNRSQESEPTSDQAEANDPLTQIFDSLIHLGDELKNSSEFYKLLEKQLIERHERDKYKDESIARMQKCIDEHQKGLVRSIKEPLIREMMDLHDSMTRLSAKLSTSETSSDEFQKEIGLLLTELDVILNYQGVELIDLHDARKVDHHLQKVVDTEPVEEEGMDGDIVSLRRNGFSWEDKILRKQEVIVKKYRPEDKTK